MTRRLKIDLFSPMPPLPTDIANHTANILPALQRLADVRVWTSQCEPVVTHIPGVEIRQFSPDAPPVADLNDGDATFYNLGNNASFHRDIHAVAREVPGIVILHDTRLQHFFAAYSEQDDADRAYYLDMLQRSHGTAARAAGQEFIDGRRDLQDLVDMAPMAAAALDGAIAGVLHNRQEMTSLAGKTLVPLYFLPLSFRYGEAPARAPSRKADAITRLIMFGFIGENRRILPILQALANMSDRDHYRLDIYGIVEQAEQVDEFIAANGLSAMVQRHGFVAESVLDAALAQADLALNLRWPSMGEASGSLLRTWAAGLPALVTRVGWYAQMPSDSVFMIDHTLETEQVTRHLRALRAHPTLYAKAGARGRKILEDLHSPELYAETLVDIAAAHEAQNVRRGGHLLAERAANVLAGLGPRELARPLGGLIARHIADLTGG